MREIGPIDKHGNEAVALGDLCNHLVKSRMDVGSGFAADGEEV